MFVAIYEEVRGPRSEVRRAIRVNNAPRSSDSGLPTSDPMLNNQKINTKRTMSKLIERTVLLLSLLLIIGCAADDDPAPSCEEAIIYEIPPNSRVVTTPLESDTSNATFWVCAGGELSLTGNFNRVLISDQGKLTLHGDENTAYVLGGGELVIEGNEQTAWLNGESRTTVRGEDNLLYYYRIAVLLEYGTRTRVEDLCGNVEVDFEKAPEDGCE